MLALLVPVQDAIVNAVRIHDQDGSSEQFPTADVSNGLRGLRIYAEEVTIPKIAGLLL